MVAVAPADSRRASRSSIGRAFTLLNAFGPDHSRLTLTELARRADLPLTTAHRLAGELVACGALERDDGGRYRIGLRLWELASLAPRGLGLRELALPFLEDLYEVTRENAQLAVRDGVEVVFVERITGRHAVPVRTRVGGRWAMHCTGVGLVLLAYAPTDVQEQVLGQPLERYTERTVTAADELRRTLASVRQRGYAVSDRQVTMDSLSVAAPIRGADGTVVAAISLVVHSDGAQPVALAPAVQAAARGVSRALR
ncbi:IclR family transcriptional regulator [Cryptosporangium aurantiacum]|uniref:Glycerol operon regulatory protein n=1 Tax=Cryptosporangium aurantiacum TaxID=134849 RepID=A0A1M7JIN5_9ACTN|nr:transcriptional regulator, IclR family [Cryptosporangium aurantiacum]